MQLEEALSTIKQARDKEEAVRDFILEHRNEIDVDEDYEGLQTLFEASYLDTVSELNRSARQSIFDAVLDGGPLLSAYNEYGQFMLLAKKVTESTNTNFARPHNSHANEVADSNNPIGTLFAILRKKKNFTDLQFATLLEAAFPLATNGLDEETRDFLYTLARDRGINSIEVANVYSELVDVLMAIRFLEDD